MSKTIFFSWASDFNAQKSHKKFITNCLKIVSKRLGIKELIIQQKNDDNQSFRDYILRSDGDVEVTDSVVGEIGSPDIAYTIFDRISKCSKYVCDVSIALENDKRKSPNPNVLIELGYAIRVLGWKNIILFYDLGERQSNGKYMYKLEDLPFDIRQHSPITFIGKDIDDILKSFSKQKLYNNKLFNAYENNPTIKNIINQLQKRIGELDTTIEDNMQNQIDSIFFAYLHCFSDMLYSLERCRYSIDSFMSISQKELAELIDNCEGGYFNIENYITFFVEYNPKVIGSVNFMPEIDRILLQLVSSNYYDKKWAKCFVEFKQFINNNFKILYEMFKFDKMTRYDIKDLKNDFVQLISDFQGIIKEWWVTTKRKAYPEKHTITIPKGQNVELSFTDNTSRNDKCFLVSQKNQYYFRNKEKVIIPTDVPF